MTVAFHVFIFDANDCIRTQATAYTADGGLSILYGQLAPEGGVVNALSEIGLGPPAATLRDESRCCVEFAVAVVGFSKDRTPRRLYKRPLLLKCRAPQRDVCLCGPDAGASKQFSHGLIWTPPRCQAEFCVTPQLGTGCSLISGLVMQAEACGP